MTPLVPGVAGLLLLIVFTAAVYDIRFRRIPNWLTLTGILLGFALNIAVVYYERPLQGVEHSAIGLVFAFVVYFIFYLIHAMGAGDVKLMAAVGAMVGWPDWFGIFVFTAILGGIMALILVVAKKRAMTTFWNVGFILTEMKSGRPAYLKKEELDVKNPKALGLPHGAVIAVATIFFLAASAHYMP